MAAGKQNNYQHNQTWAPCCCLPSPPESRPQLD